MQISTPSLRQLFITIIEDRVNENVLNTQDFTTMEILEELL